MLLYHSLHKIQSHMFDILMNVSLLLYIIVSLGISASAPKYLETLQYYLKLYISLFLIWRFNPYNRVKFNSLDAKIAFNAGIFLLATFVIGEIGPDNFAKELLLLTNM